MKTKLPKVRPKSKRVSLSVELGIERTDEDGRTVVLSGRQARQMMPPSMTALKVTSLPQRDGRVVCAIAIMHTDNRMAVRDQRLLMAWAIKSARNGIREQVSAIKR